MKNFLSKKMFNVTYDELPLASEIIVDLKLSQLKYRILTVSLFIIPIIAAVMIILIR